MQDQGRSPLWAIGAFVLFLAARIPAAVAASPGQAETSFETLVDSYSAETRPMRAPEG